MISNRNSAKKYPDIFSPENDPDVIIFKAAAALAQGEMI